MNKFRKWCRFIHRDLSFFFSGVILIYAISGIVLNHKKDFNSDYVIKQKQFVISESYSNNKEFYTVEQVKNLLQTVNEENNYLKHYFPTEDKLKVFIRGGSTLEVNLTDKQAVYESIKKRPILSAFNRLHYNPNRWWTWFSDIFVACLILITISGIIILKGKKGIWGRGGIELIIGIVIPLLFIFLA